MRKSLMVAVIAAASLVVAAVPALAAPSVGSFDSVNVATLCVWTAPDTSVAPADGLLCRLQIADDLFTDAPSILSNAAGEAATRSPHCTGNGDPSGDTLTIYGSSDVVDDTGTTGATICIPTSAGGGLEVVVSTTS